jgi:hypothetical protein
MKTAKRSDLMKWLYGAFWKLRRRWLRIKIVRTPRTVSAEEAHRIIMQSGCQKDGLLCLSAKVTYQNVRIEEEWMPPKKGESWNKDIYPEIKEKP